MLSDSMLINLRYALNHKTLAGYLATANKEILLKLVNWSKNFCYLVYFFCLSDFHFV